MTTAWCFEEKAAAAADAVLDHLHSDEGVVPPIWQLEVANVLLVAERRRRITEAQAARFFALLGQLPIRTDTAATDMNVVLSVGRRHGLSAYDASYLVLAERLGAPLATLDGELAAAARAAGITVLGSG